MPSFSVGFVARTQVHNVGGVIQDKDTINADFYVVATKTATKIQKLPMVFNLGFKATNASLLGPVGNAPGYQGRVFAGAGFAFRGPARSTILLGSEFLQEPRRVEGLPGVVVPSTITYAVRIIPTGAVPMRGWGREVTEAHHRSWFSTIAGSYFHWPSASTAACRKSAGPETT